MFFRRKKKSGVAAADDAGRPDGDPPTSSDTRAGGTGDEPVSTHSTQFLTGETGQDRRTVQVLLEAIAQVSASHDLESLLSDIVDRSIEVTNAERGLLLLADAKKDKLNVRVSRQRGARSLADDVRFSTSIANKVVKEGKPLRATVHSESEALELGRSVYDLKLRAVMCVPLATEANASGTVVNGVLYVDSRAATRQFTQADLALFAALAQHISIALMNARLHFDSLEKVRLEQSLELAGAIQRDLMPRVPTDLADWDVHGWYGPAEGTAGDFYDFVRMRNERLAIVVGDVTGHGIGPALITATAQASLRSYLRLISDPGEVVTLLNQDLCERVEDGRFLTLLLVVLENGGNVEVLNGGHAAPFIWRAADGSFETIERGGPALGVIADETYVAQTPFALRSLDLLALYSDGLTEARDPDEHEHMFGEEGVQRILEECGRRGDSAKDTALRLVEAAMELTGGLREDDITVVVVRRR